MKISFIQIFTFSLLLISCFDSQNPKLEEKMQKVLDRGLEKHGAKGVSAAIIFPDGTLWTGVSGISHDTIAIHQDMIFAIGSVTKNIVAALTLQLVEENRLSLEDPLSQWLPDYQHIDNSITIRQLLNHTSGLYMFWENDDIWKDLQKQREKHFTPEEVLSYLREPYFMPGEGWRYSNTNYLLLGMIIEKATGSTLSLELRKRFWDPLGIKNVWLSQQENIPENKMAHIYGDDNMFGRGEIDLTYEPRVSHESITFGSSGIFIAPKDLTHWCHALFEGKILQQQSMDEMFQFVDFFPVSNMNAYGLGVQHYENRFSFGEKAFGHGGGNIGSTTYMVYLPVHHVSVVVSINAFPNQSAKYITRGLIRLILKDIGVIGIIPHIPFLPTGVILITLCIFLIILIAGIIKRRKLKSKL